MIARTSNAAIQLGRVITSAAAANLTADELRRAGMPSKLAYDPSRGTFSFETAGRVHGLMFVFTRDGDVLKGRWATSDRPGAQYRWTGNDATLHRCASQSFALDAQGLQ